MEVREAAGPGEGSVVASGEQGSGAEIEARMS